jgi:CTP:molybdopterin cytidylyltransferase MocA
LSGDEGAKRILSQEASRVHLVPLADDRALVDLDTPEDWAAWRAKHP